MPQEHPVELSQAVESSLPGKEQVDNTPVTQEAAEVRPEGTPVIGPIVQQSAPWQKRNGTIIKETQKCFLVAWETVMDQDNQMVFPTAHRQFKI